MQGSLGDDLVHLNYSNGPLLLTHGLKAMTISTCDVYNVSHREPQARCAMHQFYGLPPFSPLLLLLRNHNMLSVFVRLLRNLFSCVNWIVCSTLPTVSIKNYN